LENQLEDMKLAEKNIILNWHWTMEQYEEADYYRMFEILNAKEEKERDVDPIDFFMG